MSILTDEEIAKFWMSYPRSGQSAMRRHISDAIEAAVLAKLAGMELPEPALSRRKDYEYFNQYTYREGSSDPMFWEQFYTAAQLRQASAQGSASQLSAEPLACIVETSDGANMVWPIADLDEARTYCADDDEPVLLYTQKTIK